MSLKSDRQRAIALLTASALASNRARQVLITLSGHKDFSIHAAPVVFQLASRSLQESQALANSIVSVLSTKKD